MRIKAVIFDWAGTMVDFGSVAPVLAMREAFVREGLSLTDPEIRAGMGLAKRDHVASILRSPTVAEAWAAQHQRDPTDRDTDRIFEALGPLMAEAGARRATLIPGAARCLTFLQAKGVRVGSTTGYTRQMMEPILVHAEGQGYRPEVVVCAGETSAGRPSPLMIWRALELMGVWPASMVLKVDDAPVGIQEGLNAGCLTVGVALSGNALGLDEVAFSSLSETERSELRKRAEADLHSAGADFVIGSVDDLPDLLETHNLV